MENYLTLLFGIIVSCVTYTVIAFQFIEDRYTRIYSKKVAYIIAQIATCSIMIGVNLLDIPILNLVGWIGLLGIVTVKMYADYEKHEIRRIFEIAILFLVFAACETVGYLIIEYVFLEFGLDDMQPMLSECLNMTFSKLVILIFYYVGIAKLWKSKQTNKFTMSQYITYIIIILYSIANISVIIVVISNNMATNFTERLLLLINMFCIVFADMFLLYFTKFTEENGNLKMQLRLTEQQSNLQYEYYVSQEEKYNESVRILHDANKHLRMIEEIYKSDEKQEAGRYAKEIGKILQPLVVKDYAVNPILNILLNDKSKYASLHNIDFELEIGVIDLSFMKTMEITTVFGNLLDNAIEACMPVTGRRYINMKLDTYNDFVCINIKNSMIEGLKWVSGKPVSKKGKNHGIGLLNVDSVVKKYNGNMMLEVENNEFQCSIIFNS